MGTSEIDLSFISEEDRALLEKIGLITLLYDERFMKYILGLVFVYQSRYESIPLSVAVELISTAIKYEPKVFEFVILADIGKEEKNHVLHILSLAIMERLVNKGFLESF